MRFLLGFLLAIAALAPASADENAIKSAYKEFVGAEASGDKKKALAAAERAYALAVEEWGALDKQTGILGANYANQLAISGKYGAAAEIFDHCAELLAAHESAFVERLTCMVDAGDFYVREGDFDAGHQRYRAAIAVGEGRAAEEPGIAARVGDAFLGLTIFAETNPQSVSPRGTIGSGKTSSRINRRPPEKDVSIAEVKRNAQRAADMFALAGETRGEQYAAALRLLAATSSYEGDFQTAAANYKQSGDILAAAFGESDVRTIAMRGRQKFTEYEIYSAVAAAVPPTSRQTSGPNCGIKISGDVEMEACVELRIPPYFPNSELFKGQQGFALIRFDIDAKGRTSNIEAIIDWPGGVFTERAIKSVSKWKYFPPTDPAGNIGVIENVETLIRYEIK